MERRKDPKQLAAGYQERRRLQALDKQKNARSSAANKARKLAQAVAESEGSSERASEVGIGLPVLQSDHLVGVPARKGGVSQLFVRSSLLAGRGAAGREQQRHVGGGGGAGGRRQHQRAGDRGGSSRSEPRPRAAAALCGAADAARVADRGATRPGGRLVRLFCAYPADGCCSSLEKAPSFNASCHFV